MSGIKMFNMFKKLFKREEKLNVGDILLSEDDVFYKILSIKYNKIELKNLKFIDSNVSNLELSKRYINLAFKKVKVEKND